jgi:hypothetical protein
MKSKTPWWGWAILITVIAATTWMFVDPAPSDSEVCAGLTSNIDDYSDCIERVITWQERGR